MLRFKVSELKTLMNELQSADAFGVTMDVLWDSSYYPDGVMRDKHGRTEEEVEAAGGFFWPSKEYVDRSKIGPRITLVGDHGVYLITNADLPGSPASRGTVIYAEGCNPDVDEDFYDNKVEHFGGDDGSVDIDLNAVMGAIAANIDALTFRLTD